MDVTVVNAGIGNLGAIPNMLKRLGATARITSDPDEVREAERLILPGVGAFDAAMRTLEDLQLIDVLRHKALVDRVPVLGVCLGMQLLFEDSEEGARRGLGLVPGRVVRFRFDGTDRTLRVPHMGWNYVRPAPDAALFAGMGDGPRFYFAHSYHAVCADEADAAGVTHYGYAFTSAVAHENIGGIQFHPEKSHRFGLKVFENFLGA